MNKQLFTAISTILLCFSTIATAKDLIVFPAKGQTDAQMDKDKYSCYDWAKKNSGFDPVSPAPVAAAAPAPKAQTGGVVRGAARGAMAGVIIGDNSRSTRRGAALGATTSGIRQASANNRQNAAAQQPKQNTEGLSKYNRAYSACLEGKGYTVK